MIARIWHGVVPASKGDEYLDLMRRIALPEYAATQGNRGAWCLHRAEGDVRHFEMLTFWDDVEAIKRFAGEDYERAKYYDFDARYLTEMEARVRHYEVYSDSSPESGGPTRGRSEGDESMSGNITKSR
jgi:heme-degrading monooxygenase HmoA